MSRNLSGLIDKWVVWGQSTDAKMGTIVGFDEDTGELGILHAGLITWRLLADISLFERRKPAEDEKDSRLGR